MVATGMRLIVSTQVMENYGVFDMGPADAPIVPRWKCKGGCDYVIAVFAPQEAADLGNTGLKALVDQSRRHIENGSMKDHEGSYEYVLDWRLLAEGELTYNEGLQMEFEKRIEYPPHDIRHLMNSVMMI